MNKVEAWKQEKHGFDVWPDVVRYASEGTPMAQIPEPDLERMKWHGVFYRKRVEDGRYMIRVRIPGCEFSAVQARELAAIARIGYSILDVTTRGNIQIQGFGVQQLPEIVDRLERVGLTGRQTGHDNVRNVMTHPWAGIDPEELIDGRSLCRKLTDVFMNSREYSDLPRKFNVVVEGRAVPALHCWTQDISFVAARREDGVVKFHWLLAGTQGQNPRLAWKVPVWVTEDQAPDVFRASLDVFRAEGSREKRDRSRMRFLIERIGVDGFLERIHDRLGYRLKPNDVELPAIDRSEDFIGWFRQKQAGLWAMGVSIPLGRLTHEQMRGLGDLAESLGDSTLRASYDQGIVIPNIEESKRSEASRALGRLGLDHHADSVTRNVVACTGRQFCNIAVSETKGHAFTLIDRLRAKGINLNDIKINMSGCPSACAQTYTADIGLKGVRVRRTGGTRDGFDVFLGGGAHGPVELGLAYAKGVDVDQLPELIERLVREFDRDRSEGDTFSRYWRERIVREGASPRTIVETEFRPDIWICDYCSYRHTGDDPPFFCPKCSSLRKHFARIDSKGGDTEAAIAFADSSNTSLESTNADIRQPVSEAANAPRSDGFRDVGSAVELEAKGRLAVELDGRELAVFNDGGVIRCVDGLCPHEGGPLSQGTCNQGVITCPWHDWTFDAATGRCVDDASCSIRTYPIRVEGGRLLIKPSADHAASASSPVPISAPASSSFSSSSRDSISSSISSSISASKSGSSAAFAGFTAGSANGRSSSTSSADEADLVVLEVIEETHDTKTIRLDNKRARLPHHAAGRHLKVRVRNTEGEVWKSFTISSPPTRCESLDLTVKLNPAGIVSPAIHALKPGDSIHVKGPSGGFFFDPDRHREPIVLAVAGSGVTPAMCIVRTIHDLQLDIPVTMLYGARSRRDLIFGRELDRVRIRMPNLRLVVTLTQPDALWTGGIGRIDHELLARHVDPLESSRYFLCGPGEMTRELVAYLEERSVPRDRMHTETFGKKPIKVQSIHNI